MGCRKLVEINNDHASNLKDRAMIRRFMKYPQSGGVTLQNPDVESGEDPLLAATLNGTSDKNTFFLSTGRRHRP